MFSGAIPALITPFRDGIVDVEAFRTLVEWQISSGVGALVPCGTTGESATLSFDEHYRVIEMTIEVAAGRVPVIAGVGSNDTATAIRHMQFAKAAGATAGLSVAPYYNRPTQDGMVAHFEALTSACDLPLVIYNVPGRTVTDILPATMARIAELPNVVAIKDASGDLARVTTHRRLLGASFCQLSGNDDLWLPHAMLGGVGCISVTANVAPDLCAEFAQAVADGNLQAALALHERLFPLHQAMFADASPGPAKYALARLHDWLGDEVRLPILRPNAAARATIDAALAHAGLI
jgi:4-hydroxy-tetrahydrodipicolinate synthase